MCRLSFLVGASQSETELYFGAESVADKGKLNLNVTGQTAECEPEWKIPYSTSSRQLCGADYQNQNGGQHHGIFDSASMWLGYGANKHIQTR